jgi:ribosomal protein L35
MQSHKLEKKSAKRKRKFRKDVEVAAGDARAVKKLYGSK